MATQTAFVKEKYGICPDFSFNGSIPAEMGSLNQVNSFLTQSNSWNRQSLLKQMKNLIRNDVLYKIMLGIFVTETLISLEISQNERTAKSPADHTVILQQKIH